MPENHLQTGHAHDQAAREFHEANPQVYVELRALARQTLHAGRNCLGIGVLWEVMRWHRSLTRDGVEDFKLNNNYRAWYARELMRREPELVNFFEIRGCDEPTPAPQPQKKQLSLLERLRVINGYEL
ncbi:MAG: hypothetical protein KJ648_07280 [Candidatus Omnitrophica bacterium]|nr:hypothetical protein [Candidatus Omnitrophota bacterium]